MYVLHWMDAPKFLGSLLSLYSIHYSSNRTKNKKEPMRSSLSLSFLSLLLFNMLYYLNSGAVFMTNHCTGSIGTKSMAFSLASSDQVTFLGASIPLPFPPQWPLPSSQEYLWVSLPEGGKGKGERGDTFRSIDGRRRKSENGLFIPQTPSAPATPLDPQTPPGQTKKRGGGRGLRSLARDSPGDTTKKSETDFKAPRCDSNVSNLRKCPSFPSLRRRKKKPVGRGRRSCRLIKRMEKGKSLRRRRGGRREKGLGRREYWAQSPDLKTFFRLGIKNADIKSDFFYLNGVWRGRQ